MATGQGIRAGRAFVELYADDSRLTAGLKASSARLKSWGASTMAAGAKLFAAGGAVIAPLLGCVKTFMSTGDALDKMSGRVGASVEFLSALSYAAQIGGTDIASIESDIRKLHSTAYDASRGLGSATEAFDALGISVVGTDGKLKSTEQLFMESVQALSRVESETKKAALAQDLFGRSGTALLPMLKDGAEGLAAVMEKAHEMGVVMTTEDAAAAAVLTDAWTDLKTTSVKVAVQIGGALAPSLTEVAGKITAAIGPTIDWIKRHSELIVTIFKLAAAAVLVAGPLIALGATLSAVGTVAAIAATVLGAMLSPVGLLVTAVALLVAVFVDWGDVLRSLTGLMGQTALLDYKTADAMRQESEAMQAKIKRLEELRSKQTRTNMETAEAVTLANELKSAYPALASQIDAVGTAAGNTAQLMYALNRAMLEQTKIDLKQQLVAGAQAYKGLKAEADRYSQTGMDLSARRFTPATVPYYARQARDEGIREMRTASRDAYARAAEQAAKNTQAQKLLADLENATPPGATGAKGPAVEPGHSQADYNARNAELQQGLQEIWAKGREDPMQRELELLRLAYDRKYEMAKESEQDLALLAMAERAEIAQIEERYAEESAAKRLGVEEDLADEIARLEIELATKPGPEREAAMMAFERDKDLREAEEMGLPENVLDEIQRKYELMFELSKAGGGLRETMESSRGTFSAAATQSLQGSGPMGQIAKNTADAAAAAKKSVEIEEQQLAEMKKNRREGGLCFTRR
ncbi:MAG TPA: phage tail tape measure protein [Thermoguttaceae bacterium]|nr:phage tail tape measure protein [Thermoguttaceae bacterium]